jgi:hypothetical protein
MATRCALGGAWLGALAVLAFVLPAVAQGEPGREGDGPPQSVIVAGDDVQAAVDAAPPHSVVTCNRNRQLTLATPLKVRKPLTLVGLNARLPDGLGRTPLVVVQSESVSVLDVELRGNGDTVPQEARAALLVIEAGNFRVERGLFLNSSKDGILIEGGALADADLTGGVVRDIVGREVRRDLVSVGGSGQVGHRIRNVLIDNVRSYDSEFRGAVEVSDGSENVTVRKVYAERCRYAVDVQDHKDPGQINRHVLLEDIYARECTHAIRTANRPLGHANLTIRDVTAERCIEPLAVRNTDNVVLHGISVIGHESNRPPVAITNCDGLSVRDVTVKDCSYPGPAVLIEDCDHVVVDGVTLRGRTVGSSSAVLYRISTGATFSGLRVTNVFAAGSVPAGIVLERRNLGGTLSDYVITGNVSSVVDQISGPRGVVADNVSPAPPTDPAGRGR